MFGRGPVKKAKPVMHRAFFALLPSEKRLGVTLQLKILPRGEEGIYIFSQAIESTFSGPGGRDCSHLDRGGREREGGHFFDD